jgi:O-antigen/teichoic acid export membrane protein
MKSEADNLSIRHIISKGSIIAAGRIVALIASFAVVTVMGRYVPREIIGTYNFVIATLAIISISTFPGMNSAIMRAVAKGYDGTVRRVMQLSRRGGMVGSLITVCVGIFFLVTHSTTLGVTFIVVAPFISLTDTFHLFTMNYWQGKRQFIKSSATLAGYYVLLALFSIPVFFLSHNVTVIVLWVLVSQTIAGLLVFQSICSRIGGEVDEVSVALGRHITVMQALNIISANMDRVAAWWLVGPAMTAVYTFASTPIAKAQQLIPLGVLSLTHLSTRSFTHETKRFVVWRALSLFALTIPIVGVAIICAPWLYKILFPLFPESAHYFQILSLALIFTPRHVFKSALIAFHKTRALYASEITSFIVKIITLITLGITFGLLGIVTTYVVMAAFDFIALGAVFVMSKIDSATE